MKKLLQEKRLLILKKISQYLKCKFAHVCNSGTSAIFLALKSIDLKKDDIVIMPAINFIASYNVAKFLGAKVFWQC